MEMEKLLLAIGALIMRRILAEYESSPFTGRENVRPARSYQMALTIGVRV